MTVDVDLAVKEQRNHRIVRMPVKRDTLRGVLPIRPETHFMVIADDSKVVASGHAPREDGLPFCRDTAGTESRYTSFW